MLNTKTPSVLLAEFSWAVARYKWVLGQWRHQAISPNDDGDSDRFYDWVVTPAREDWDRLRKELAYHDRERPHGCIRLSMVTRYRLHHPVIGFIESAKQVVTIPAGAVVTIASRAISPGLCAVSWDGKQIEVYRMDVERHGVVVAETKVR